MTNVKKVGDLELEQDLQHQQRTWTFERTGWIVMSLIAIAALLGLTGSGWLSQADRLIYIFHGTAPSAVTIFIQPERIGFLPGSVRLEGTQPLQFQQFIYP